MCCTNNRRTCGYFQKNSVDMSWIGDWDQKYNNFLILQFKVIAVDEMFPNNKWWNYSVGLVRRCWSFHKSCKHVMLNGGNTLKAHEFTAQPYSASISHTLKLWEWIFLIFVRSKLWGFHFLSSISSWPFRCSIFC